MRKILFRAKPLIKDKNGMFIGREEAWVFGDLVCKRTAYINSKSTIHTFIRTQSYLDAFYMLKAVDSETVCEYSGLNDFKRNKIFENDVFRNEANNYGIVRYGLYNGKHQGFYIDWFGKYSAFRKDLYFWSKNPDSEIIGDIFNKKIQEIIAEAKKETI